MSSQNLHGILVALITPFTDGGLEVDEGRLETHIEHLIAAGVHGLVPGGTTGEFTAMALDERKHLLELCIKRARGRVPVVAGIGALSTKECVDLATHAAGAAAAALMVVPLFYDSVNVEQLRELVAEIHDASGSPIMYYNIPSASGLTLSPREIAELSEVGVQYLKDTSGNAPDFTELLVGLHHKITAFQRLGHPDLLRIGRGRKRVGLGRFKSHSRILRATVGCAQRQRGSEARQRALDQDLANL